VLFGREGGDDFLPVVAGVPFANSAVQPTLLPLQIHLGASELTNLLQSADRSD